MIDFVLTGPAESPLLKMKFNFSALNSSVNKKLNGYNISGHCGKFLWIRIALLEKLLRKIVEDLQANAKYVYMMSTNYNTVLEVIMLVNLQAGREICMNS